MIGNVEEPALYCEACGTLVKKLTGAQAQEVARNPYNYVTYCYAHKDYWKVEARRAGLL